MNTSLFDSQIESSPQTHPLAYQLAPKTLNDYIGQDHIVGKGKPLRNLIENDQLFSMVLWGPPGCGKTSLSRLISAHTKAH